MKIGFNFPEAAAVDLSVTQGDQIARSTVDRWKVAHDVIPALSGRMNVFHDPAMCTLPMVKDQGNGSFSLDLTRVPAADAIKYAGSDGRVQLIDPLPQEQRAGWGDGEYYFLELDEADNFVVEPGRNHRKIYVTNGPHGLTAAQIAKQAGVAESTVTGVWLTARPEYGSTEQTALAEPLGQALRTALFRTGEPASHWYLMERGYHYAALGYSILTSGESELHPVLFGAWGSGARPVIESSPGANRFWSSYIVIQGLEFIEGFNPKGMCIIVSDCVSRNSDFLTNGVEKFTVRNTKILDVARRVGKDYVPISPGYWEPSNNRSSSVFMNDVTGLLMDRVMVDMGGWGEGYDTHLSADFPQPPSGLSHALYIQYSTRDCFFRDMWISRGASMGLMSRAGGTVRDCFLAENNIVGALLYGDDGNGLGTAGNYALIDGTVATSSAWKRVRSPAEKYPGAPDLNTREGAYNWGWQSLTHRMSMVGNIVAHHANPDDPVEQTARPSADVAVKTGASLFADDSIVHNWGGETRNAVAPVEQMNATTAQLLAQHLTGEASLKALFAWARSQPVSVAVRTALDYFRSGYGAEIALPRKKSETLVFRPDARGEGYRWDNRLNWSTGDLPGNLAHEAGTAQDSVDLNGNFVRFGGLQTSVAQLRLAGGTLDVTSGKLAVGRIQDEGAIVIRDSGQLWTGGNAGVAYTLRGGRLVLGRTEILGDMAVSGNAQLRLGPDATLPKGRTLRIDGSCCTVGWFGRDAAKLTLSGTLDLRPTMQVALDYDPNKVRFKRGATGFVGQSSGFTGTQDLLSMSDRTNREIGSPIWFRDFTGRPVQGEILLRNDGDRTHKVKTSARITVSLPTIAPLSAAPDTPAEVVLSGPLRLDVNGMGAGTHALIIAAITGSFSGLEVSNLDPALDATVAVTATGVTLTLAAGTGKAALA